MNNNFGNVLLVIILVLIVGFGVWYVTMRQAPQPEGNGIQIELRGDDGTADQGPGDN